MFCRGKKASSILAIPSTVIKALNNCSIASYNSTAFNVVVAAVRLRIRADVLFLSPLMPLTATHHGPISILRQCIRIHL